MLVMDKEKGAGVNVKSLQSTSLLCEEKGEEDWVGRQETFSQAKGESSSQSLVIGVLYPTGVLHHIGMAYTGAPAMLRGSSPWEA